MRGNNLEESSRLVSGRSPLHSLIMRVTVPDDDDDDATVICGVFAETVSLFGTAAIVGVEKLMGWKWKLIPPSLLL